MKASKNDNKGFSLVELIVVVLIMGVIAVALAPQVMKWVGTSKENTDANNAANLKSSVNAAVAEYMADNNTTTSPAMAGVTVKGDSSAWTALGGSQASLCSYVDAILNGQWPATQAHTNGFIVEISATGVVKVYYQSSGTAGSYR